MSPPKPPKKQPRSRELTEDELDAEIAKKYGGIIIRGADLKTRVTRRISSGSLSFDIALGGGWPLNVWNEIIGEPSSGKTSSIFHILADKMAADPNWTVLWVASEPFAWEWAEAAGVDVDRVKVVETNVMEEAFDVVIRYAENKLRDCIVIDSLPALVPSDENEALMEEWQMGLGARLTGKFFRKQAPGTRRSLVEEDRDILLIVVNQFRDKIGVMFGDPRTTPGGKAKDYWFAIRAEMVRDEWIDWGKNDNKRRVGITIQMRTIKNKTAPPFRRASVDFYFDPISGFPAGSYDVAKDLLASGLWTDVIEKAAGGSKGNKFTFLGDTWYGEQTMLDALRQDLGLQRSLRREVLRAQGIEVEDEPVRAKKARTPTAKKVAAGVVKKAPTKRVLKRR